MKRSTVPHRPIIEIENLNVILSTRERDVHALRNINMTLNAGETLSIIGESGSGKSTLLMTLLGLLPVNATVSGNVRVNGVDVLRGSKADLVALRWNVASMVFQASSSPLNPVRRIGHQLYQAMRLHGATRARARQRSLELLEMVRLPARCAKLFPHELSGGMRQRAVIALALCCDPQLLLADEPTTALDPIVQEEILELLLSLTATLGLTFVLVSHDLQLVRRTQGRLSTMLNGEIVETGDARALLRNPTHPHLKTLVDALPVFGGETTVQGKVQQ